MSIVSSLNMLTVPVTQKAETFTGRFLRLADTDVVKLAESQAMQQESSAADVARNLFECIKSLADGEWKSITRRPRWQDRVD